MTATAESELGSTNVDLNFRLVRVRELCKPTAIHLRKASSAKYRNQPVMPITVVGRPAVHYGRPVMDILLHLRDFGVGRILGRTDFSKYPEPSYFKVVKVEPLLSPDNASGTVWADTMFRGRKLGIQVIKESDLCDFYLIHKADEEAHCNKRFLISDENTPRRVPKLPPLVRAMETTNASTSTTDSSF